MAGSLAWMAQFRRLARDYKWLPNTLDSVRFAVSAYLISF